MNLQEFRATLANDTPPQGISTALQAMWHQGKGDWDAAHSLTQSDKSSFVSWVHAHLHRVEGDKANAAYWYRLAGKPFCTLRINEEWIEIVGALVRGSDW